MGSKFIANPYLTKDMRRQILKIMILQRIKSSSAYSYAIIKEFDNPHMSTFLQGGSARVKNDVYNTIAALERSGYIRHQIRAGSSSTKKYYNITPKGKEALRVHKKIFMSAMKEFMKILK